MAGHTISAYADEQTYRKVSELAKAEDRSTAQIVAAALRLYMRLPRRAHDALRRLEAAGPDAIDAAAWAAGRALLDQQYEQVVARGLNEGGHKPTDLDEEALLEEAVSLVRKSR
jgi:predicted transcriptional regulator